LCAQFARADRGRSRIAGAAARRFAFLRPARGLEHDDEMKILGIVLVVLGLLAVAAAGEIMNSSEVNTLRGVGGGVAALGLVLVAVGASKTKKA